MIENNIIDCFHSLWRKRTGVLDFLFANCPPSRILRQIVLVGRPAMKHVTRTDFVLELRRIIAVERIFHGIEVVQIAEELIKPMNGWQKLIAITEVVLAELDPFRDG